jgi:prophage DNA circulation protein
MFREDAKEAVPIVDRALTELLSWTPARGRPGAEVRNLIGRLKARLEELLAADLIGPPLDQCFDLARRSGITRGQMAQVRLAMTDYNPTTVGAIVIKNSLVQLSLATEGHILANMSFATRMEVELLLADMNTAFLAAIETVADTLDSMTYRVLVQLHAAVVHFLTETGRPLPRMMRYQFAGTMPSLVMAHRLYGDAGRADQLRLENKVIHPAFMLRTGRALSQ